MSRKLLIPRLIKGLGIFMIVTGIIGCGRPGKQAYGVLIGADSSDINKICEYETVVIDAEYFTSKEIEQIKQTGSTVYSYLNIGSLEEFRDFYEDYKDLSLGEYENWEDETWIDVSDKDWQEHCISLAQELKDKGVEGFFIDNCDVYYNYPTDAVFNGLTDILKQISAIDEDVLINGGDVYVTKYIETIDSSIEDEEVKTQDSNKTRAGKIFAGVNQESVYTRIDFENDKFEKADEDDFDYYKSYLENLNSKGYKTYVIEYATDSKIKKEIKKKTSQNQWITYVSTNLELK